MNVGVNLLIYSMAIAMTNTGKHFREILSAVFGIMKWDTWMICFIRFLSDYMFAACGFDSV